MSKDLQNNNCSSKAFSNISETMAASGESTPAFDIKKTCLRPIFLAMTLCGCYCPRYDKSITCKALRVYKVFVFLCSVLYLAKTISAFWFINKQYYSAQLLQTIWAVTATFNFFISVKSTSERYGHQHRTLEHWSNNVLPKMDRMGVGYCRQGFRKRQKILLSVAAMLIVTVMATHIALIPRGTFLDVFDSDYLTAPLPPTILSHTINTILVLVIMMLYTIPVFYVIILAKILSIHFQDFKAHLQSEICKSDCKMPDSFQELRILHNQLCGLVSDLDKDMRYLYGNMFTWNIAIALLCLYMMVKGGVDFVTMTFFIYFFLLSSSTLALMSIFAAIVNEEAHAPLDTIYFINVSDVSLEKTTQINLFLSKLTGTQVGFSTCGLLVITKEFILTIAGVFLTYFAVLYTL